MVLGAGVGILINPQFGWVDDGWSTTLGNWLNLPGEIFIKLVQMVMIPLIFASIISGLVSNVSDNLKSFGIWLFVYFVFTTVVAILIGVLLAFLFSPGQYVQQYGGFSQSTVSESPEAAANPIVLNFPESIANLIPVNPLEAILTGELLSVVIFTVIIGIAITQLENKFALSKRYRKSV